MENLTQLIKLGFFWLAIAMLVVVTLGVAYLTWIDRRERAK
ncbi:MAG: hypothetical protein SFT94_03110 [Pseudanabaenaceae cyanobacterium bins.68]|nr:hypothetical protein [Pseudanabaenaceae cyanobacterium bins.68]